MFITFEGPEGGGKTTQIAALADFLRQRHWAVLVTREPGGTPIGDRIREILVNVEHAAMNPHTEILLFLASRAQLVDQVIRPHLEAGGVVLSDRYADSTLAYQGFGHGVDLDLLRVMIDFATGGLKPELTILLDLDVERGLRRRERSGGWNRLDAYPLDFHQRMRQGFLELAGQEPDRWTVVDAGQPFDRVQGAIRQVVLERLEARAPLRPNSPGRRMGS